MKTFLSPKMSALFVVIYLLCTLGLRFWLEPQLQGVAWISMAMGAFGLLFLWALSRVRFITFDYFLGPKAESEDTKA